jgi:hypothetical protein
VGSTSRLSRTRTMGGTLGCELAADGRAGVGPRRSAGRAARSELESDLRWSVKALAALVAAGVALVAAGCGGDDDDEPAAQNRDRAAQAQGRVPPKLVGTTAVEGGSTDARALLRRVMDGMEQTTLKRIEIGPPGGADGKVIAIEFTPISGVTARRQWDEWIVAGAFSRRLLAAGSPADVDGVDSRGGFRARPRLSGKPDPRPLSAAAEKAIVRAIRNAARRSGADVVSLEAHRPYGLAIALTLATDDPATFLKKELRGLLVRLDAHRPRIEGIYIALLNERRRIVLEWGSWTRNPAGTFWVRPDLADCSPIRQAGPPGTKPPPKCPA